ncbi:MAG TPA: VanZ family protein [Candidatus Ozemobacteraceae bacterium]|nr:VanZ family protein [Candidatus Ozemobacteraceae bacterium]
MKPVLLLTVFLWYVTLIILSLRGSRSAYLALIATGLLYFPARVGFKFNPGSVDLSCGGSEIWLALFNYPHVILFALFFFMTSAQFPLNRWSDFVWAGVVTISFGIAVEIAQGITGNGHCRVRDLIPDTIGVLIGATIKISVQKSKEKSPSTSP